MLINRVCLVVGLLMFGSSLAFGAAESADPDKLTVTFGGFVDTYYAYDFDNPANHDRVYTTQPDRHNEFNINLAYLDARVSSDRIRGRLALQLGTSVQANYASEPTLGLFSGPSISRHMQEANVGYRLADRLWIDAGIFLSHIGLEGWISKDNWTYTRSLIADYSPYYETGVKATWQVSDPLAVQLLVLNGWQNISENNSNKAVGAQVAYTAGEKWSFSYNNFLGNEVGNQRRFFNDFIFKYALTEALQLAASYDVGLQRTPTDTANAVWQGYAAFARYQLSPKLALTLRGEQYFDRNQVIVTTGSPSGFQTTGASVNADVQLHKQVLWRTELRGLWSKDPVFPTHTGNSTRDGFVVTSLALWF